MHSRILLVNRTGKAWMRMAYAIKKAPPAALNHLNLRSLFCSKERIRHREAR